MDKIKPLFTATATATGGRNGHTETSDGSVKTDLSVPKEMGGPGRPNTATPEHLFAAGYAACFGGALDYVAKQHKKDATKQYLYALFNSNSASLYIHNGVVVDEQHVAQYLTPSAAKQMLSKDTTVVNKTHNIKHSAIVRTISLSSIVSIKARKRLLTVV